MIRLRWKFFWEKIDTVLLGLILFLAPANFFLKISAPWVLVHGLPVDYLYPKLYLVDILILAFLWRQNKLRPSWLRSDLKHVFVSLWFIFCGAHLWLHRHQEAMLSSTWMLVELSLCGMLLHTLIEHKKIWKNQTLRWFVVIMLIFQAGLGVFQSFTQHQLAGYWLLGEPKLSTFLSDIAKSDSDPWKILPYGTAAHPNILATWLCFGLFALWILWPQKKGGVTVWIFSFVSFLSLFCIWLTESLTAYVALGMFIAVFLELKLRLLSNARVARIATVLSIFTALLIPLVIATTPSSAVSWARRAQLQRNALSALREQPIAGTGLNLSASQTETFGEVPATYRFRQPVHNVGLLWLTETGLVGFAMSIFLILIAHKLYSFEIVAFSLLAMPIILILSLDHYVLSLHSGQLLLTFLLAFIFKKRKLHSLNDVNAQ